MGVTPLEHLTSVIGVVGFFFCYFQIQFDLFTYCVLLGDGFKAFIFCVLVKKKC